MTSAGEVFVVQLARASRKANRFVRHLQRADRDEIIAAALAWCWENRENYSLTTTLDTWFVGAVRDAYKAWHRGELQETAEQLDEIPTGDTTQAHAEAQQAAEVLMRALPQEYKRVAKLQLQGYTREEMRAAGVADHAITDARARIKQLRRLLPDDHEYRRVLRTPPASDNYQGAETLTAQARAERSPSGIDHEIAKLDFPPQHGKDCPPCWQCKWFDGFMPGSNKPVRMTIVEPEVSKAIKATEAEKIRIAKEVQDGNL